MASTQDESRKTMAARTPSRARRSNEAGELRLSALNLTSHLYTDGIHYTLPAASKLDVLAVGHALPGSATDSA